MVLILANPPTDLRNSESLSLLKSNGNCQCKICKTYIRNVGYVDWRQKKFSIYI